MADVEDVLTAVRETDWSRSNAPWVNYLWDYQPASVAPAFEALVHVENADEGRSAAHNLLNALAHNHSGTPYPAIVEGVRHLVDLVPLLNPSASEAAIRVLTDAYLFTSGDTDTETVDGVSHDLTRVHVTVATLTPHLEQLAADRSHPASAAAVELLELILEVPPTPSV